MTSNHFGDTVAQHYDADTAALSTPQVVGPVVDLLADLAGDGRALELAIGTGRVALPLVERGVPVDGIDLSPAMLARLRAKPGGDALHVVEGDIATARTGRTYALVFLVFNGINNLTTQDAQVACFRNAAEHLAPGGHFVVEVGVPALRLLPPGQHLHAFDVSEHHVGVDEYHFATQDFTSHHVTVRDGVAHRLSVPFRYVFPEELDLMAKIAGLHLAGRWAGWQHEPFTDDSTMHVSAWRRPD